MALIRVVSTDELPRVQVPLRMEGPADSGRVCLLTAFALSNGTE